VLELGETVTREQVNEVVQVAAERSFSRIIEFTQDPIVSSDVVGNPHSCVFDSLLTHVLPPVAGSGPGSLLRVLAWYDNEWGYANRLCELLELCAIRGKS
jgi:glyceraldehyde 3-phosphate dehydrogenase